MHVAVKNMVVLYLGGNNLGDYLSNLLPYEAQ
jgi:hypothetical protein